MIPDGAIEAAVHRSWHLEISTSDVREILDAAAPYMLSHEREQTRLAHVDALENARTADQLETKLAAIIVALDPFERSTNWKATRDEAGCPAFDAVLKIRAILDATP